MAHSFWSWVKSGITIAANHQDYTNTAIGPSVSFSFGGQPYQFDQKAVDAISLANSQVDMESIIPTWRPTTSMARRFLKVLNS
jgi:hypothetical protein